MRLNPFSVTLCAHSLHTTERCNLKTHLRWLWLKMTSIMWTEFRDWEWALVLVQVMSRLLTSRPQREWVIALEYSITNKHLTLSDELMLKKYNFDMIKLVPDSSGFLAAIVSLRDGDSNFSYATGWNHVNEPIKPHFLSRFASGKTLSHHAAWLCTVSHHYNGSLYRWERNAAWLWNLHITMRSWTCGNLSSSQCLTKA